MIKWLKNWYRRHFVLICSRCGSKCLKFEGLGQYRDWDRTLHNFYTCLNCRTEFMEMFGILFDILELQEILFPPVELKRLLQAGHKVPWREKD